MSKLFQRFSLAVPLALSIGVPYMLTSESTESMRGTVGSWFASAPSPGKSAQGIVDPEVSRLLSLSEQQLTQPAPAAARVTPVANLEGVLRFDITPQWIMDNWPRVATTRNEGGLDGLRVPLITGTRPEDVAGSLTYYFDKQRVVQRIALDGVAGDDRNLVTLVTRSFQLQPEPQAGVGIFVSKWNGEATSALWIRRLPVVSVDNPFQKFEFSLELNRPNHYFGLSPMFRARLQNAQASAETAPRIR
ncbi:MAG: DUF6690 family protein [Pirellulaceae bacterium]